MAGSVEGARKAAEKMKQLYGADYFVRCGRLGGRVSRGGGFGQGERGRELARIAGAKGGRISKRTKRGVA
jgi:hypothetical protein